MSRPKYKGGLPAPKLKVRYDNKGDPFVEAVPRRENVSRQGIPPARPFAKGNKLGGQNAEQQKATVAANRERKKRLSDAYKVQLEGMCTIAGYEDYTWAEAIALGVAKVAATGDVAAARELRETTEGKTPDKVMLGGMDDAPPIAMEVEEVDNRINQLVGGVAASEKLEEPSAEAEAGVVAVVAKKKRPAKRKQAADVLPGEGTSKA